MGLVPLLVIVWLTAFGVGTAVVAARRHRPWPLWAVFGALTGAVAIGILFVAPPGRCPSCGQRVQGWSETCDWCGGRLLADGGWLSRSGPATAPGPIGTDAVPLPEPRALDPERRKSGHERDEAMAHRPLQAVGARPVAELVVLPPPADAPLQRRTGTTASHDAAATSPAAAGSTRDGAERPGPTADPRQEVGRGSDPGGILATAVYLGGTADMTVGSRYFIVRTDRAIRIQGPIESDPSAIVLERGIEAVDATVSGNALLVTDRGVGRRRLEMAFTLIGGRPLDELERAILAPMEDESAGEGSTAGHGAA